MSIPASTQLNSTQLNSTEDKPGFTLIELLVVIAIIAVLATIGFATFRGIMTGVRDSRRKEDIQAIAKAMEIHFGQCSLGYCDLQNDDFAGGIVPQDPLNQQAKCANGNNNACQYCFTPLTGQQPGGDPNWANNGCSATIGVQLHNEAQVGSPGSAILQSQNGNWILCANLETLSNGKYYYCISNQQ